MILNIVLSTVVVYLLLRVSRLNIQNSFYKGYFDQKQRNLGKDPAEIIAKEFPEQKRFF